jgi:hypothetical protein
MKHAAVAICILFIGTMPVMSADDVSVYRWVDANGVPQYTDRPPNLAEASETGIRSRRTDPAALQARLDSRAELNEARNSQQAETDAENAASAERREVTLEQRSSNCQKARDRLKTYETAHRLYRPLPSGERDYLSDGELDSARNEARQAVSEWCD